MCERLENTIQHDVDQTFDSESQMSQRVFIWCNIMECLSSVLWEKSQLYYLYDFNTIKLGIIAFENLIVFPVSISPATTCCV